MSDQVALARRLAKTAHQVGAGAGVQSSSAASSAGSHPLARPSTTHRRLRLARSPAGVRRGPVAVVAHGSAATARLVRLLAERQLGVSVVLDVDSLDLDLPDVVRWAATDPRVRVVVVQSPVPCRDALKSVLDEVEAYRAPVVVMDGSARGGGDATKGRELHATTMVELADIALLLLNLPQLAGPQVAVVTSDRSEVRDAVNRRVGQAGLLGPDLTQHAEQRSKFLSPGTQMSEAVTSLACDVSPEVLLAVLATIGERGVDAIVLALASTPPVGRRDLDRVLRNLKRTIPHVVIVNVAPGPGPGSRNAPVPVFASEGAAITALGEVQHAGAAQPA